MTKQSHSNGKKADPLLSLMDSNQSLASSLSVPDGSLVGRMQECDAITRYFKDENRRLVTLAGMGGIGKTSIARKVAKILGPYFAHGSVFVPLAPIASVDLLVPALSSAVGYTFYDGETPKVQLLKFLIRREQLLILDNFEHLMDGAGLLAEILQAAPGVRLLVTSRERLNLREEWVLDVHGLDYRHTDAFVEEITDAMQLFLVCARRVKANFRITETNKTDILRICQLVEGVPLAIELAAAWVRFLSCQAIGDEIEKSLDFLTTRLRDTPQKHRSIRMVFAHSYDLLTADEQQMFNKLTVFSGGFQREAATAVAGADLASLADLVDKSLLRMDSQGRYDMHELLRQFGNEKLKSSGIGEQTLEAHSAYFAEFMDSRCDDLKGRRQLDAISEIKIDFENVRTAWNWATDHKSEIMLMQMIESLWVFCECTERHPERTALFHYAEQRFATINDAEPEPLWGRLLARSDPTQSQLETALQIARQNHDEAEVAFCLIFLAREAYKVREFERAKQLLEESLAIYTELDNRYGMAKVYQFLFSSVPSADWDEFKIYGETAHNLCREIGDEVGMAWSLAVVATHHGRLGDLAACERFWLERVELGYKMGNLGLVGTTYGHLGHKVYFLQGDFEKTRMAADEAYRIGLLLSQDHIVAWAVVTYSLLEIIQENYEESQHLCHHGKNLTDSHFVRGLAEWSLALAACGIEDYEAAQRHLVEASIFLDTIMGLVGISAGLPVVAMILHQHGQSVRATELLALAMTHPAGAVGWMKEWSLVDRFRAALENKLGSHVYQEAWEQGEKLNYEAETATMQIILEKFIFAPETKSTQPLINPLTKREMEVLEAVAKGLKNREIAEDLVISYKTVKTHVSRILHKLDVKSRTAAVAKGRDLKLLD